MARIWQYRFGAGDANDFDGIDVARWVESALRAGARTPSPAQEPAHTAHLNAADGEGTLVALTATHGPAWFGGRWAIPGSGVVMNGGMHNFSRGALVRRRGRGFGVSNMSPTIACDEGGNRIALGCPGARRIPSPRTVASRRRSTTAMRRAMPASSRASLA
jgi:gamma-glutamyltranspeptidase